MAKENKSANSENFGTIFGLFVRLKSFSENLATFEQPVVLQHAWKCTSDLLKFPCSKIQLERQGIGYNENASTP